MRSILLALIPLMSMACALGADLVGGDSDTGSDKKESEEGEDGPEGDYEGDNGDPGSGAGPASGNAASGQTGPTSGPTSGTGQGGDFPSGDACCIPSMTPGCGADPSVEQCVCANDDYCCTTAWDDQCVGEVDEFGCGFCGGGFGGGDPGQGGGDPGGGECCMPTGGPGCGDQAVADCVCQIDDYCCSTEWDDQCVQEVLLFGCGIC